MPRFKMLRGPEPGLEIPLEEDVMTIGRGRKNNFIIQDNEVSRVHCRLIRVLDDYEIHDLKSTNGTFVNGQKLDEGGWLLSGRSLVELGDSITFEYIPTDIATGTAPPMPAIADSTPPPPFYLLIQQKSVRIPEIYLLDRLTLTIGRDVPNDIVLQEPDVSRYHLRLVLTQEGYTIEDLNTMNGTHVNKYQVSQQRVLRSNDLITIGTGVKMWYTDDPDGLIENLRNEDSQSEDSQSEDSTLEEYTNTVKAKAKTPFEVNKGDLEKSIFLVYASDEWQKIAASLHSYLKGEKLSVFCENYLSPNTEEWDKAIEQAIEESPILVAVISEESLKIPYVQRTINHFISQEKPMVLVKYGEIENLPSNLEGMDIINHNTNFPYQTYRRVNTKLRSIEAPQLSKTTVAVRKVAGHGLKQGDLEHSVFLAYARDEWQKVVIHLQGYLDSQNIPVFSEQYLTPSTEDWDKAIEQAMLESPCLLAVISEASLIVPYVQKAVRHFLSREKTVLLVQYGKVERPPMMLQSMAAIRYDEENNDRTFRLISAELRRVGL